MLGRITDSVITYLEPHEVFVFGSNLSGRHGKGAAKTALGWGAIYGQAEGLQGRTYGIPTKNASIKRTLSVNEIRPYIERFVKFAKENPGLVFLVTEIGCGLADRTPKEMGKLFNEFDVVNITNIHLPKSFWRKIKPNK